MESAKISAVFTATLSGSRITASCGSTPERKGEVMLMLHTFMSLLHINENGPMEISSDCDAVDVDSDAVSLEESTSNTVDGDVKAYPNISYY